MIRNINKNALLLIVPFLIINLSSCYSFYTLPNNNNVIIWNAHTKLITKDFHKRPKIMRKGAAEVYVGIAYILDTTYDTFDVTVESYFLKNKSWIRLNDDTAWMLPFSQEYFDLTEVYARKIRKTLSEHTYKKEDAVKYLHKTMADYNRLLDYESGIFYQETYRFYNKEEDEQWSQKIKQELQELNAYSSPVVKRPMK